MENVQNLMEISKMQKKIAKTFLVSEIIASEMAALSCLNYDGNTSHGKSMR